MSARPSSVSKRKLDPVDAASSARRPHKPLLVKQTTLSYLKALTPSTQVNVPPATVQQLAKIMTSTSASAETSKDRAKLEESPRLPLNVGSGLFSLGSRVNNNGLASKKIIGSAKSSFHAKKLIIRDFKLKPTLPLNFEEDTWKMLQTAIHAIEAQKPVSNNLEELYKACESLCHHKFAASLFVKLQAEIRQYVLQIQAKLLSHFNYQVYSQTVQSMIRSIFLYLDRTYVLQSRFMSIWDYSLHTFKEIILEQTDVPANTLRKKLVAGILELIKQERYGETVQRSLLKSSISVLIDLQLYTTVFEPVFIEHTITFYATEASEKINTLSVSEYLLHVEGRLMEESERVQNYLDRSTKRPSLQTVEKKFIETHYQAILEKGFNLFMKENRLPDLSRLYTLLQCVGKLDKLREAFFGYARTTGSAIVAGDQQDEKMVDNLLEFKATMDSIVNSAFHNTDIFVVALKDSFERFINERRDKPAELIAKFVDKLLRSNKTLNEDGVETTLDKVLLLFRFVQGKDTFEAFYKKDLAKRLLLGKTTSIDAEKGMLARLKTECGPQFTQKLEKMFTDMDISRELMNSFRRSKFASITNTFELNVTVLQDSMWPAQVTLPVKIPERISRAQDSFTEFYLGKNNGRRLTWQHHLGQCALKAYIGGGYKELHVSVFQATILLLFNPISIPDDDNGDQPPSRLSYKAIKDELGLDDAELKRQLQSLACGKVRVLQKSPRGKDIDDSDEFEVNKDFQHPQFKIKINQIQVRETKAEQESTHERVQHSRGMMLDAAIVRIMKMRKTIDHTTLFTQLVALVKFPVSKIDYKKCIEGLIERDYMERDEENATIYKYIA